MTVYVSVFCSGLECQGFGLPLRLNIIISLLKENMFP